MAKDTRERWSDAVGRWCLPVPVRPTSAPLRAPTEFVSSRPGRLDDPTARPLRSHLEHGGVLLDVGCGAASLSAAMLDRARVIAVEPHPTAAAAARAAGVEVVEAAWPACAGAVGVADVVLCTHVFYEVGDLVGFAGALTAAARDLVLAELTLAHPAARFATLLSEIHAMAVPRGPTAQDMVDVLIEGLGVPVARERWQRPGLRYPDEAALCAHVADRFAVPDDLRHRLPEVLADVYVLGEHGTAELKPDDVVTLRWPGAA